MQRRWYRLSVLLAPTVVLVGCDTADSRVTVRVEGFEDGRVCLVPERDDLSHLKRCYPYSQSDRERLNPGACVRVVIPNQLEPELRDDPNYSVHSLDRERR